MRAPRYVGYVACSTFYFFCLFAFLAGSPFVYIEYFGVRPQYYGFLFGVNMIGMIAASYLNSRIVTRYGADRILRFACAAGAAFSLILLVTGIGGVGAIAGIALPLFLVLSLLTVVASNAISGALTAAQGRAGAGAALAGALQFGAGAAVSAAIGRLVGRHPAADGYHHLRRCGAGVCRKSDVAAAHPRLVVRFQTFATHLAAGA